IVPNQSPLIVGALRPGTTGELTLTVTDPCLGWVWIGPPFLEGIDAWRFDFRVPEREGEQVELTVAYTAPDDEPRTAELWIETGSGAFQLVLQGQTLHRD